MKNKEVYLVVAHKLDNTERNKKPLTTENGEDLKAILDNWDVLYSKNIAVFDCFMRANDLMINLRECDKTYIMAIERYTINQIFD